MQGIFVQEGDALDYTPSSDTLAGAVIIQGAMVGITKHEIKANILGAIAVEGLFDVVQSAVTFAAGGAVYWAAAGSPVGGVASSGAATTTASGNTFMGFAIAATLATDATVRVNLRSKTS